MHSRDFIKRSVRPYIILYFNKWTRNYWEICFLHVAYAISGALLQWVHARLVSFRNMIGNKKSMDKQLVLWSEGFSYAAVNISHYECTFQLGVFNIAQYDSFMFFAHVLNESLAAGEDPTADNNLAKRMWNATFSGEYILPLIPSELSTLLCGRINFQ